MPVMVKRCAYCGKRTKRKEAMFCSRSCYTISGRRIEVGRVNGKKWADCYWKKFLLLFEKKYGHLDRVDQIRIAVQIGMKRAYRGQGSNRKANPISKQQS